MSLERDALDHKLHCEKRGCCADRSRDTPCTDPHEREVGYSWKWLVRLNSRDTGL